MSWERYDDSGTRWSWTADEERHLLLFDTASGELREYHESPAPGAATVHVYGTLANADELDAAAPLADASHMETHEVPANFAPWVRALDDRELFEYLESGGYAK